ncbi:MAG: HEAT repeat domain-containing protein [Candidatus Poribacteria bacterium]|nr:HEAT repeat domain-containing protein [Candidatus Poribacteria bacterium]MDE0506472.1 HEAT repeat domain-containing protein [Candidatus Poribacteria bacterium]
MNRCLRGSIISICLAVFLVSCGSHNEYLSKGKELIKSERRRKEERAVAQFKLAIQQEPSNAEAHYLLGFYDSQEFYNAKSSSENWEEYWEKASTENRGKHMFLAYQQEQNKYLEILVFETLRRNEPGVQNAALNALKRIYKQGDRDKLLKSLKKAIKSKDNRDRHDAHWVLAEIGKDAPGTIVPLLVELLDHKRKETRLNAVKALGEIRDENAIPELVKIVNSGSAKRAKDRESPEVRQLAVEALGKIGGAAVKELVEIAENKGSSLRVDAIQALATLGDERAVNPLLNALGEQGSREVEIKF